MNINILGVWIYCIALHRDEHTLLWNVNHILDNM